MSSRGASAIPGPSRIPYDPISPARRRTRQSSLPQDGFSSLSHNQHVLPTINEAHSKSSPRHRSVSFQPPDDDDISRPRTRASRHSRKVSEASHLSVRLTPPAPSSPVRSRAVVRLSLTGPKIMGMSLDERAAILIDIAADCLVTLIRSAFDEKSRRKSLADDGPRKAWAGLYALRQSYIFPPETPFPDLPDVIDSLDPQVRESMDFPCLNRCVSLSNLCTFVWTILRPDEAGEIIAVLDEDEDEFTSGSRLRKGKGRARIVDEDALKTIKRRNRLLYSAWKKFWTVVVPREKRSSESALRIWVDFATQLQLIYQTPSASAFSPTNLFPPPPESLTMDLFSSSAVARYGQWGLSQYLDSQAEEPEIRNVNERWGILAKRRAKELEEQSIEVLLQKYPYDIFRQEMMAYIQHEVLGNSSQALLTPGRRKLLFGEPAYHQQRSALEDELSEEKVSNQPLPDQTDIADWDDDDDDLGRFHPEDAAGRLDHAERTSHDNPFLDTMHMDILKELADDFEREEKDAQMNIAAPHTLVVRDDSTSEDEEWAVHESTPKGPRLSGQHVWRVSADSQLPRFNWTARQDDAQQIEWDSQSLEAESPPLHVGASQLAESLPAATAFDDLVPSESQLDPLISHVPTQKEYQRLQYSPPSIRIARSSAPPRTASATPRNAQLSFNSVPHKPIGPVTRVAADEESSEGEEVEEVEDEHMPTMEAEIADVRITDRQLAPIPSISAEPITPTNGDDEFADLIPWPSQIAQGEYAEFPQTDYEGAPRASMEPAEESDELFMHPPASQKTYTRPRNSLEAHQFAPPDEEEDRADRALLEEGLSDRASPTPSEHSSSRQTSVKPDLEAPLNQLLPMRRRVKDPLLSIGVHRDRSRKTQFDGIDPYLVDNDGELLTPDDLYTLPGDWSEIREEQKSALHGRQGNRSSQYCRLSGHRRWTKAEELLLYRSVQRVPMSEEYPLRVVWAMHGEFGRSDDALKWFNPQHMKDKMRVIVNARMNQGKVIQGRARFWLPRGNPLRQQYDEDMRRFKQELELQSEMESDRQSGSVAREDDVQYSDQGEDDQRPELVGASSISAKVGPTRKSAARKSRTAQMIVEMPASRRNVVPETRDDASAGSRYEEEDANGDQTYIPALSQLATRRRAPRQSAVKANKALMSQRARSAVPEEVVLGNTGSRAARYAARTRRTRPESEIEDSPESEEDTATGILLRDNKVVRRRRQSKEKRNRGSSKELASTIPENDLERSSPVSPQAPKRKRRRPPKVRRTGRARAENDGGDEVPLYASEGVIVLQPTDAVQETPIDDADLDGLNSDGDDVGGNSDVDQEAAHQDQGDAPGSESRPESDEDAVQKAKEIAGPAEGEVELPGDKDDGQLEIQQAVDPDEASRRARILRTVKGF